MKDSITAAAKISFVLLCAGGLLFSMAGDSYVVHSLAGPETKSIRGPGFTEVLTYDGLMARDGKLYDIYSIAALSLKADEKGIVTAGSAGPGDSKKTRDCKT